MKTSEKYFITFKEKVYQLIGYSIIDFPQEFEHYKETSEQILTNSIYYSETYGVTYLDLYEDIGKFIEKYGRTYTPVNSEYIFKSGLFIKGTFIYKLIKNEN